MNMAMIEKRKGAEKSRRRLGRIEYKVDRSEYIDKSNKVTFSSYQRQINAPWVTLDFVKLKNYSGRNI